MEKLIDLSPEISCLTQKKIQNMEISLREMRYLISKENSEETSKIFNLKSVFQILFYGNPQKRENHFGIHHGGKVDQDGIQNAPQ